MPTLLLRRTIIALLCAGVWTPAESAQKAPDLAHASLEELMTMTVTTATRTAEGLDAVPARMEVVTAAQIARRGYQSLIELLGDLPDFKIETQTDQDYAFDVVVDGVRSSSKVIVLLDGMPISSPTNEPLPILANYPVHAARQVEIVYGPASALYGADAFSAVVNIISADAGATPSVTVTASAGQYGLSNQSGSFTTPVGANGSLLIAGQAFYDRQPDLSRFYPDVFRGLDSLRTGTFQSIFGPMTSARPLSPNYENPISAHSLQATLRSGGLHLTLFQSRERTSTSPPANPDNTVYNDAAFDANTLFVAAGSLTHHFGRVTSTSTLTFRRHEMDPQSGYWNTFSNFERSYKYAYGTGTKAEQQFSWKAREHATVTVGGSFERLFAIPQTADLNAPVTSRDLPQTILGTAIPDDFYRLHYSNTGGYAQLQYAVRPHLSLTAGARADYNTRYAGTFNPRVGLVATPTASTTFKVLYGTAFLAPTPYQAYAHYGSFISADGGKTYTSDYWHLPNPDLKPQQKKTVEAMVRQSLGSSVSVSASAFYSRFTNQIQFADGDLAHPGTFHGWPVAYIDFAVNEGSTSTYGTTLDLRYVRAFGGDRRLEARGSITAVDGRVWRTSDDTAAAEAQQIGAMSPLRANLGVDLDWGAWSFAPRLTLVGTQRLLATTVPDGATRDTIPGYARVDVTAHRRLFEHMSAFIGLDNALDRRYTNINLHAGNPEEFFGMPQNPRRLIVGVTLESGRR